MKRGQSDPIEFLPDSTKSDQAGEFVIMKNVYGNPKEPLVNCMLAIAVWISLNSDSLPKSEKPFLKKGVKYGSASATYCRQLSVMMKRHNEVAMDHINTRRANPHGIRKVSVKEYYYCLCICISIF